MTRRISIATLVAGLLALPAAQAENLYRWVDEAGQVHFTTTLPPEASDRPYDIYSPSGVLLESVSDPKEQMRKQAEEASKPKSNKPIPLYSEEEKKAIADRLLVLKYQSQADIIEARDLELDHLKYDERILESTRQSLQNSLADQIHLAADRQRAGLEIEEQHQKDIDLVRNHLLDNQASSTQLAIRKQKIQDDFDVQLQRYRTLVAGTEETAGG